MHPIHLSRSLPQRRRQAYLTILVFLLTLAPLGFGHTDFGKSSASLTILLLVATLVYGALFYLLVLRLEYTRSLLAPLARRTQRALLNPPLWIFLPVLCLLFLSLSLAISFYVFEAIPRVTDTNAQYVHAKMLAQGYLTFPSHRLPQFFDFNHMINNGRWYSQFPPGHVFLLALGHWLHIPWIVNPLMGMLSLLAIYFLARETHGELTSRTAAVLTVLCPFVVFMSSEYMNHATTLLFTTLFILFFIRSERAPRARHAILAASALGIVFVTRPLTALAISIPWVAHGVHALVENPRKYVRLCILMTMIFAFFVMIQLGFNYLTNGNPLTYGYAVVHGEDHVPQFGSIPASYGGGTHTLWRGIGQTFNNLNALNFFLFRWPFPSLIFVLGVFLSFSRNRINYLFLATLFSLLGVHLFYFFQDWCFGPRFVYEASGLMIILTASGILRLPILIAAAAGRVAFPRQMIYGAAVGFLAGMFAVSLVFFLSPSFSMRFDYCFRNTDNLQRRLEEQYDLNNALVFITAKYYWVVGHVNPQSDDAPVIYARNLGKKNQELIDIYPERKVYLEENGELTLIRPEPTPFALPRARQ